MNRTPRSHKSTATKNLEEELRLFLTHHDPRNVGHVDKFVKLAEENGREGLNSKLKALYGDHLDTFPPQEKVIADSYQQLKNDLTTFYNKFDSGKAADVEGFIELGQKIARRKLNAQLKSQFKTSLDQFCRDERSRAMSMPSILFSVKIDPYVCEEERLRDDLRRYFSKFNQSKSMNVDDTIKIWRGFIREKLGIKLKRKYGISLNEFVESISSVPETPKRRRRKKQEKIIREISQDDLKNFKLDLMDYFAKFDSSKTIAEMHELVELYKTSGKQHVSRQLGKIYGTSLISFCKQNKQDILQI